MNRNENQPNIVWILADDLGYGDLGCYGQQLTKTPRLDRMAAEGLRFTECYAGAHMCAPSRATLLTGKHEGHSSVREIWFGNNDRAHLHPHEKTIAWALKEAGYETALIGKRHAIDDGMTEHFGFDRFFHVGGAEPLLGHHYPTSVITNDGVSEISINAEIAERVEGRDREGREFSFRDLERYHDWEKGAYMDDLSTDAACRFIREKAEKPFFLYLSFHAPHTWYNSPSIGSYAHKKWDPLSKGYVAMIERLDSHVGMVLDALGEAGIDENTVVFFTSDNGGVCRDGREGEERIHWIDFRERMKVNRDLRKGKHYHFEGGIRVPMIVRWPAKIRPKGENDLPWYFADAFPTLAEIGRATDIVPDDVDGSSVLPTLMGMDQPELQNRPLFWEAHKFFGFYQVVRKGDWKLIRWTRQGPRLHPLGDVDPILPDSHYPLLELFNLREDHREEHNLAEPESPRTNELISLLDSEEAHTEDAEWPLTDAERRVFGNTL